MSANGEILKKSRNNKKCIFCAATRGVPSFDNLVLHKGKLAYVIMNKFPYSNGHVMVIPHRHVADFSRLMSSEHAEIGTLIGASIRVLKKYARCHGINLGMNLGEAAGAGIKGHLHYHVVPRWHGDHNFMPVLAGARVVPEHLLVTYKKLKNLFAKV